MNLPNRLTIARVCLIPVFLILLLGGFTDAQTGRFLAMFVFIIASLTDLADGMIARKHGLITNFGKLMDPLADKMLVTAALAALIELGALPSWIVIIIVSREFLVTGIRLVALSDNHKLIISAELLGKIKTSSQMIMIIWLLLGLSGGIANYISIALITLAVVMTVVSGVDYVIKNKWVFKGN